MTKSSRAKKLLSLVLSLSILMSCMVWSGVSAAQQTLSTNFTGYEITSNSDVDQYAGSKAQVVNTGDAAHGQAMKLYYNAGATSGRAGFRFFANTKDKFQYNKGTATTYTKVTFSYQVQKLNGTAKLNVMSGAINWKNESFISKQALGSDNHKTAAVLTATATPGMWQTVSVVLGSDSGQNSAIHIYLETTNAANEAGSAVYVDDVTIITEYDPSNDPDNTYSFPIDDLTKTALIGNGSGEVVQTGAEYDHSGSATGKGVYMHMNQPYTALSFHNAARFWLENASGHLKGAKGSKYIVTAWVKSMRSEADDFYWAIGTADKASSSSSTKHNYQESTFASSKVTLQPGVWTKITTTINALAGSGGNEHYMTFAGGFAAAHNDEYVYVDDITVQEFLSTDLPPLAADPQPTGTLVGTQAFESGAITNYVVDKNEHRDPAISDTVNYTDGGSKSLAVLLEKGKGNNGNAARPRFMVKLGDATTADNYAAEVGGSYVLSFWVRSSRRTTEFTYYVSTMTDPTVTSMQYGSASQGDSYRTIQLAYSNLGVAAASQNGTEFKNIVLEANQWTQIVVTIPEVKAHGTDANAPQYLCIHYGDADAYDDNANFTNRTLYMDDVSLYRTAQQWMVNYEVNGGDTLAPTLGEENTQVELAVPTRVGYAFEGWYADAGLNTKATSPYTLVQKETTLYAKWKKDLPQEMTLYQDFEAATSIDDFKVNNKMPFTLATDKSAGTGTKALKTTVQKGYNGNFNCPLWAFQMGTDAAPMEVVPGMPATVTFSLMATRDVASVTTMISTVNDLSAINANPKSSSVADGYRTMQVLQSSTHGSPAKDGKGSTWGTANAINQISLKAGEWITMTVEIGTLKSFKSGTQYLVLALGDSLSYNDITPYDLYLDNVKLVTKAGGQTTNVTFNTMGGDEKEPGVGVIWDDITEVATRAGYKFDGWFTDKTCQTLITTYPPVADITLYAGWTSNDAEVMDMEIDKNFTETLYVDMDLDDGAVSGYYAGNTNMTKIATANHTLVSDGANGTIVTVNYGSASNGTTDIYGIRLVGKDSTASGFSTKKGECYEVSFRYRVDALPVATEIRVLEGSINWNGPYYNKRADKDGFNITKDDVGKGWQTGYIRFTSTLGGVGVHLALHADDYTSREGTIVSFDDIKIKSFQLTDFTYTAGISHVEGEENHTKGGDDALKVTSDDARVVYCGGVGEKLFDTNNAYIATLWARAEADTQATLKVYAEPDLTKKAALDSKYLIKEMPLTLKAGEWARVQAEFLLSAVDGAKQSYVSVGLSTAEDTVVYLDDFAVGMYNSDFNKLQTFDDLEAKTHSNAPLMNGELHGLNGNTVVSGIGYDGSEQSLRIDMMGESELEASRAVLFIDKKDVTAPVNNGYIITFYAMVKEDMDVTFGLGTSGTIDLSDLENKGTLHEAEATTTVSLKAGKWQGVSVSVSDLQGKNPELTPDPYITLAAWFAGAAVDNAKSVYIDNLCFCKYYPAEIGKEDILCFENTDEFGFGKNMNLSTYGSMEVVLEQNHTKDGYYSVKVITKDSYGVGGGTRPQFNLVNANGKAVKVEKGKNYRVSYWIYVSDESVSTSVRHWLTITDRKDAYTKGSEKDAELIAGTERKLSTKVGQWVQISETITDAPRSGYLRLGVSGTSDKQKTVFYLDDIRVFEYKIFELTGEETVMDYEKYNPEDGTEYIRRGVGYISDEMNHTKDGQNSMRLESIGISGAGRNQMIIINPATQKPYEFKVGEAYIMSFWVYCSEEYTDDFNFNTWLWGTDDVNLSFNASGDKNNKNGTFEYDGGVSPTEEDGAWVPGEWNHYEISFVAKNGKYMLWGTTDGSNSDNYVYYIDDVEITVPRPATVIFDANGGVFEGIDKSLLNEKGQYVEKSFVGLLATGPSIKPYLQGKQFNGWALDAKGEKLFDLEVDLVPNEQVTLYAVWGEWNNEDGYNKIDKTDKTDKEEIKYKTEIEYEKIWTGNAAIPVLDSGDRPELEDADPVTHVPAVDDPTPFVEGLPAWLIIVIIVAAVVVVGGGAFLALLLLKSKKSDDEKEVNA